MDHEACVEALRGVLKGTSPPLPSEAVEWIIREVQKEYVPRSFEQFERFLLQNVPQLCVRRNCKETNLALLCFLVKHALLVRDKIPTANPALAAEYLRRLFGTCPDSFECVLAELRNKGMGSRLRLVHFFNVVYKLRKERHVLARLSHEQLLITIAALPDTCDGKMKLGGGARSDVLARRLIVYFLLEYPPKPSRSGKEPERSRDEFNQVMAAARKLPKPSCLRKLLLSQYGDDWFDDSVDDADAVTPASPLSTPPSTPQSPISALTYSPQQGFAHASMANPLSPTSSGSSSGYSPFSPFSGSPQPFAALPTAFYLNQGPLYDGTRSPVSSSSSSSIYYGDWSPYQQISVAATPYLGQRHGLVDSPLSSSSSGSNSTWASYPTDCHLQIAEFCQHFSAAAPSNLEHSFADIRSPSMASPSDNDSFSAVAPILASPTPGSPVPIGVLRAMAHAVPPPSATELPYGACPDYNLLGAAPADEVPQGDYGVVEDDLLFEALSLFLPRHSETRTAH